MNDQNLESYKDKEIKPQSKNSLKHGLTAKKPFFIDGKEEAEKEFYSNTLNSLMNDLTPDDHIECRMVENLALILLKQYRIEESEGTNWYKTSILDDSDDLFINTKIHTHNDLFKGDSEKLHTYRTAINNSFHKTLEAFMKYREHKLKISLFSNRGSYNG